MNGIAYLALDMLTDVSKTIENQTSLSFTEQILIYTLFSTMINYTLFSTLITLPNYFQEDINNSYKQFASDLEKKLK